MRAVRTSGPRLRCRLAFVLRFSLGVSVCQVRVFSKPCTSDDRPVFSHHRYPNGTQINSTTSIWSKVTFAIYDSEGTRAEPWLNMNGCSAAYKALAYDCDIDESGGVNETLGGTYWLGGDGVVGFQVSGFLVVWVEDFTDEGLGVGRCGLRRHAKAQLSMKPCHSATPQLALSGYEHGTRGDLDMVLYRRNSPTTYKAH